MTGLRESKRAQTRAALAQAAFELVRERGLTAVTVDDIVATLPVSRRTFSNYFTSKEEAVVAVITERARMGLETWVPPSVGDNVVELVPSLVAHQVASGVLGAEAPGAPAALAGGAMECVVARGRSSPRGRRGGGGLGDRGRGAARCVARDS
jgi:predicted DNA-binding protein (UPF0251 family)